jgi:hypothetical protein
MIRMEKSSKLTPVEAIDTAVAFFGPGGLDLEVTERAECCVRLEGGGGYVLVEAEEDEGGNGSLVEVESREWDYHVKRFLGGI